MHENRKKIEIFPGHFIMHYGDYREMWQKQGTQIHLDSYNCIAQSFFMLKLKVILDVEFCDLCEK